MLVHPLLNHLVRKRIDAPLTTSFQGNLHGRTLFVVLHTSTWNPRYSSVYRDINKTRQFISLTPTLNTSSKDGGQVEQAQDHVIRTRCRMRVILAEPQ